MTLTASLDVFAGRLADEFNAVRAELAEATDSDPTPVTLTATAGVITPDAAEGSVFRHEATADVTLAEPPGGVDGQEIAVAVLASGGTRTLTITDVGSVPIPSGRWWVGELRYDATTTTWLLDDTAGQTTITTGGSGAVDSVNGRSGIVTGLAEASDVTAALADKASTAYVDSADQALDARVDALEAAPSGDAVDSVNGETGVVVLDAADVGADPAGTAAGLVGALAAVATSGSYNDLADTPTIPSVGGLAATTYVDAADTALDGRLDTLEARPLVESTSVTAIVTLTQAAYDALGTPDPDTLYLVSG